MPKDSALSDIAVIADIECAIIYVSFQTASVSVPETADWQQFLQVTDMELQL